MEAHYKGNNSSWAKRGARSKLKQNKEFKLGKDETWKIDLVKFIWIFKCLWKLLWTLLYVLRKDSWLSWGYMLAKLCQKLCMGIFFKVSSIVAKDWKQSKCSLEESWVNQSWYIHMIESLHGISFPVCKPPFSLSLLVTSCSVYHHFLMEDVSDLPD